MLSELIKNKTAFSDLKAEVLTIRHPPEQLTIDQLPPSHRHFKIVTFNYCQLYNLQGIQQFVEIEQLNIKFNCLEEVQELERISNKDKLLRLDFSGNQIEYLGGALFINLKQIFPNLIELNGKDYSSLLYARKGKKYTMKKILNKVQAIERQMTKTIKTSARTKYKPIQTPFNHDQIEETTFKNRATVPICHGNNEYAYEDQYEGQNQRDMQQTSRQQDELEYEQYEVGLKENKNFNNVRYNQNNDISLGGLSNIPMTKSMRASILSQYPVQRKKGLQILTLNESLQAQQAQLVQPTATFAVQRQKQNAAMFRNKNGGRYSEEDRFIQEEYLMNSKDQEFRPTKRATLESDDSFEDSQFMDGMVSRAIAANYRERMLVIDHLNQLRNQQLKATVFGCFKRLLKNKNLPMQLYLNDF